MLLLQRTPRLGSHAQCDVASTTIDARTGTLRTLGRAYVSVHLIEGTLIPDSRGGACLYREELVATAEYWGSSEVRSYPLPDPCCHDANTRRRYWKVQNGTCTRQRRSGAAPDADLPAGRSERPDLRLATMRGGGRSRLARPIWAPPRPGEARKRWSSP